MVGRFLVGLPGDISVSQPRLPVAAVQETSADIVPGRVENLSDFLGRRCRSIRPVFPEWPLSLFTFEPHYGEIPALVYECKGCASRCACRQLSNPP
jgi:hypothetical protein